MSLSRKGSRASSPVELAGKRATIDPYLNSLKLFKQESELLLHNSLKLELHLIEQRWYKYAAQVDTQAAYEFRCIADGLCNLDSYRNYGAQGPPDLPLEYIVSTQHHVFILWQEALRD